MIPDPRTLDANDPLNAFRAEFALPPHADGEVAYFCGNSLGLMPRATPAALDRVFEQWRQHAVEAHFTDADAWMSYHQLVRDGLARVARRETGGSGRDEHADHQSAPDAGQLLSADAGPPQDPDGGAGVPVGIAMRWLRRSSSTAATRPPI